MYMHINKYICYNMYMGARACGRANGAHARNFAKKVSLERISILGNPGLRYLPPILVTPCVLTKR